MQTGPSMMKGVCSALVVWTHGSRKTSFWRSIDSRSVAWGSAPRMRNDRGSRDRRQSMYAPDRTVRIIDAKATVRHRATGLFNGQNRMRNPRWRDYRDRLFLPNAQDREVARAGLRYEQARGRWRHP